MYHLISLLFYPEFNCCWWPRILILDDINLIIYFPTTLNVLMKFMLSSLSLNYAQLLISTNFLHYTMCTIAEPTMMGNSCICQALKWNKLFRTFDCSTSVVIYPSIFMFISENLTIHWLKWLQYKVLFPDNHIYVKQKVWYGFWDTKWEKEPKICHF